MSKPCPKNGGNGYNIDQLDRLTPEQLMAFKNMIFLAPRLRREVIDMVVLFELVKDQPKAVMMKEKLRELAG